MADEELSWSSKDKHDNDSKRHLIGSMWTNSRNGHSYKIIGVYFQADTDEWMLAYKRTDQEDPVPFIRSDVNFFGINRHGQPRFIKNECNSSL